MTMTKFEPVARLIPVSLPDYDKVWARTFDEYPQELSSSNPFVNGEESPLYTADQLTEAYEAGKRDASADLGQAAFEKWLYDKCPSGDVESVQRQWLESYEYAELAGKRDAISKWQPIETAPKDGTAFRAYADELIDLDFNPCGSVEAAWSGEEFIGCVWNGQQDAWYGKAINPTHWMPLPAAPKGLK